MSSKLLWSVGCLLTLLVIAQPGLTQEAPAPPNNVVKIFKQSACGCCGKWIEYMKSAGFTIESEDVASLETIKAKYNVPIALRTCHTALVDGYVVEGHVPADVIVTLLRERPDVVGIGVAGMPKGSAGMESPTPEPYDVLAFRDGHMTVFAKR